MIILREFPDGKIEKEETSKEYDAGYMAGMKDANDSKPYNIEGKPESSDYVSGYTNGFTTANEMKNQQAERVHVNVSLSKEEKRKLKEYAFYRDMTVSKVIQEFIASLGDEVW